jgi:CheY-like chemotaxis protein
MASVLIVDDDPDIRDTIADILSFRGYRVVSACNGAEALTLLKSNARPCLILLDLMMPVVDGWEFRARQSEDEAIADVPVAIISGNGPPGDRKPTGAVAYLRKPLELSSVLEVVARHCSPSG